MNLLYTKAKLFVFATKRKKRMQSQAGGRAASYIGESAMTSRQYKKADRRSFKYSCAPSSQNILLRCFPYANTNRHHLSERSVQRYAEEKRSEFCSILPLFLTHGLKRKRSKRGTRAGATVHQRFATRFKNNYFCTVHRHSI